MIRPYIILMDNINKNDIFLPFDILSFTKTFFLLHTSYYIPTTYYQKCVDGFESYIDVKNRNDQAVTLQTDSQGLLNYFCFKKCDTKLDEIEDKLLELDVGITSLLLIFLMQRLMVVEDIFFHTKLGLTILFSGIMVLVIGNLKILLVLTLRVQCCMEKAY